MGRPMIPRVTTGWRVIATVSNRDGEPALKPISRVFACKSSAETFRDLARAELPDAYIAEVVKPERKVPDIA